MCREYVFFLSFGATGFRARVGAGRFGGVDERAQLAGEGGCGVGGDFLVAFHALRALETIEGGIFGGRHYFRGGSKEVAYVESIEEETRFGLAIKVGRAAFVLSSFVMIAGTDFSFTLGWYNHTIQEHDKVSL